jgi:polysaccharide export outer membrane protein
MMERLGLTQVGRVVRATACRGASTGIALAATILLGAVAGPVRAANWIPDSPPAQPPALFQPFLDPQALPQSLIERTPYRLNVSDMIEIIYQVRVGAKTGDRRGYRLQAEDVIEIKFPFQKELDQRLVVLADGYVNCLFIGRVRAVGETLDALEAQLKNAYKRYIRRPELTVIVKEANKKIDELKKAITTAPRGQSRLMPVKPDGTIDLPYVGQVLAFGKTVAELRAVLNQEYVKADLEEVEVTVQLLEMAPRKYYVLGEVTQQGMQSGQHPMTVIQAIAASGGYTPRADLENVLVIRRKFLPIPQAAVVNVASLLGATKATPEGLVPNGEQMRYDFWLQDDDVVYVPPSGLALANDWIDQVFNKGIRQIFPVTGILGMNFGYQTYNAPAAYTNRQSGPPRIYTNVGP